MNDKNSSTNTLNSIAKCGQKIASIVDTFSPIIAPFITLAKNKKLQTTLSIFSIKTILHPIYYDLFESIFSETDIEKKWGNIKNLLLERFPENLCNDNRFNIFNELLECQENGHYTAVCRSVYPEIEHLIREELLVADTCWKEKWDSKTEAKHRKGFLQQQFKELIKNNHDDFKIFEEDATLEEIGIMKAEFQLNLETAFETFDPSVSKNEDREGARHQHCHGWKRDSSFMDGLNGLLIFDMAMQYVSEKKQLKKLHLDINSS